MKKALKNKKAFTLVELMVVVAILGVLVAVAVPAYKGITAKAEENVCATNRKIVEEAYMSLKLGLTTDLDGRSFIILDTDYKATDYPDCIDSRHSQLRQITRKHGDIAVGEAEFTGLKCPTLERTLKTSKAKAYYPINPETGEVYCRYHKPN